MAAVGPERRFAATRRYVSNRRYTGLITDALDLSLLTQSRHATEGARIEPGCQELEQFISATGKICMTFRTRMKRDNGLIGCLHFPLPSCAMQRIDENISLLMRLIKVVIVDDRHVMRKVIRALLTSIGVQQIFEAGDGVSGLDAICTVVPHVVLLDWDMPGMSGAEFVRKVRSPATFSQPDVPIIILTGHVERSCVIEAERLGVHEYLVKPVFGQALLSCIVSVVAKPRPFVQIGDYYGPKPRKPPSYKPDAAAVVSLTCA